jgi:O-antigen ligase
MRAQSLRPLELNDIVPVVSNKRVIWQMARAGAIRVNRAETDAVLSLIRIALPCALFILIITSPLATAIDGRNIENINFYDVVDANGFGAWLSRMSTLAILAVCLAIIALRATFTLAPPSVPTLVMLGYVAFFVTGSVLNSLFGTVPAFSRNQVYPLIILTAIYMQRNDDNGMLIATVKAALLTVLLASLLMIFVRPLATMRSYAPELRLPFISFRFWGLGDSPNSMGPAALLLMFLTIYRPFRSQVVTLTSFMVAAVVLLIAQSQTAWATAALVLPTLLVYRWFVDDEASRQPTGSYAVAGVAFAFFLTAAGIYLLTSDFVSEIAVDDKAFTGRGKIWRVALDLFYANPMFGYGPTAWEPEFRMSVAMPFAFTAHNQILQSLSTSGLVGLGGLIAYLGVLIIAATRLARPTRGLAPAILLSFPLIRSFSEASFDFKTILGDEFILHMIMFIVMTRPTDDIAYDLSPSR